MPTYSELIEQLKQAKGEEEKKDKTTAFSLKKFYGCLRE